MFSKIIRQLVVDIFSSSFQHRWRVGVYDIEIMYVRMSLTKIPHISTMFSCDKCLFSIGGFSNLKFTRNCPCVNIRHAVNRIDMGQLSGKKPALFVLSITQPYSRVAFE